MSSPIIQRLFRVVYALIILLTSFCFSSPATKWLFWFCLQNNLALYLLDVLIQRDRCFVILMFPLLHVSQGTCYQMSCSTPLYYGIILSSHSSFAYIIVALYEFQILAGQKALKERQNTSDVDVRQCYILCDYCHARICHKLFCTFRISNIVTITL